MFTWYSLLKFVHVAAVIAWVGGIVALSVINARLGRQGDRVVLASLARQTEFYGRVVIAPAAAVVLIAGVAMVVQLGLRFETLWILWGFVGLVGFFLIGAVFSRRAGAELGELARTAGPNDPRVIALQRRLAVLTIINLLLLFSTVWAMVFKPTL